MRLLQDTDEFRFPFFFCVVSVGISALRLWVRETTQGLRRKSLEKKNQALPTHVSLPLITKPSGHATRQRYDPTELTHLKPDGQEALPRTHSSKSTRQRDNKLAQQTYKIV